MSSEEISKTNLSITRSLRAFKSLLRRRYGERIGTISRHAKSFLERLKKSRNLRGCYNRKEKDPHGGLVAAVDRSPLREESLGVMIIITRALKGRPKLKWWSSRKLTIKKNFRNI